MDKQIAEKWQCRYTAMGFVWFGVSVVGVLTGTYAVPLVAGSFAWMLLSAYSDRKYSEWEARVRND
jgi:hypothetical protein